MPYFLSLKSVIQSLRVWEPDFLLFDSKVENKGLLKNTSIEIYFEFTFQKGQF